MVNAKQFGDVAAYAALLQAHQCLVQRGHEVTQGERCPISYDVTPTSSATSSAKATEVKKATVGRQGSSGNFLAMTPSVTNQTRRRLFRRG